MRGFLIALALSSALTVGVARAQTSAAQTWPALPDLTSYLLLRTEIGRSPSALTIEEAADALKNYDVILFGEWHDHAGNHLAEMALLRALQSRNPRLALSLEQFERDVQPVLDDYLAGRIGEDALRRRGRAWPNYTESYRPLVEYAREHKLPVIAANAPGVIVRCVGQEGPDYLSGLAADKRAWVAKELHLDAGAYRDKYFRFLAEDGSHGANEGPLDASGQPTAAALRSFASQVTRDDTMAESIALFLRRNPGHTVMHVTGAFHVAGFLGTAERLRLRAPDLKVALINPVNASDPEHPSLSMSDAGGGNFTLLLKATPKEYANEAERKAAEERIRESMRSAAQRSMCME